jgi:hypothetical protein
MLVLHSFLLLVGFGFLACAGGMVLYDVTLAWEPDRILRRAERRAALCKETGAVSLGRQTSWRDFCLAARSPGVRKRSARLRHRFPFSQGWASSSCPMAEAASASVRSPVCVPGRCTAAWHFIRPLFDRVGLYDGRERVFATNAALSSHEKLQVLTVEACEGPLGRYLGGADDATGGRTAKR